MKRNLLAILNISRTVKPFIVALSAFALVIALPPLPMVHAAAGDLDDTFGANGKVLTAFDFNADGNAVAGQSDGKIVVVGEAGNDFAVARFDSSGLLDSSFGSGGKVTTDFDDNNDQAYAVAIQTDGKIIAAGSSGGDFALVRYNSNGFPDSSFGSGGKVTFDYSRSGPGDIAYAVAIQTDGKIVVAGSSYDGTEFEEFALLRFNSNGLPDNSFGIDGIVITAISGQSQVEDSAYAVAIQADGMIVVAGESTRDFAVARFSSDGSLDTSFGNGGIVITDFTADAAAHAVALQTDGKIVVAGESEVYDDFTENCKSSNGFYCQYHDFALVRYNSDGSLDSSFGDGGKVTTNLNPRGNDDFGFGVAIQTDGKIVVAGYSETSVHTFNGEDEFFSTDNQFSLARYNGNGSLDTTFSTDGMVITDIDGSSNEKGNAVAIQTDGKIVLAGTDIERGTFALIRLAVDEAVITPPSPPVDGWATIAGSVNYNGDPQCAMVLANGQYVFSCKAGNDFGTYDLNVPLDSNGKITLQVFVSGLAPFKLITDPSNQNIDIDMQTSDPANKSPAVTTLTASDAATPTGRARITGTVDLDGTPLCAMVLANGQYMFSCGTNNGTYDLTVPLDGNDQITLFVFVSGLQPYRQTFAP